MKRAVSAVVLLLAVGCQRPAEPLQVNVVMPAHARAFAPACHKLVSFSAAKPITLSGQPIVVVEAYPRADEFVQFVASNPSMDIIIADTLEQIAAIPHLDNAAANARNVCASNERCPAVIAPWVPADKKEAVQRVFAALTSSR